MHRTLRAAVLGLGIPTLATAQDITLDKVGGGLPGPATFQLQGTPGHEYLLLFALEEQTTPVPALDLTLEIPTTFVESSFGIPGFYGVLDGNGQGSASLVFPADPVFESITLSMQALAGCGPYYASNLIRLTPQLRGTFRPTIDAPTVPIAGGGIADAPDGSLVFVGGSGPIAQRYDSRIEEWEAAGASFGVGLFSQTTGLADGRVLFTGGIGLDGQPTADAAIYDPATQQTTTLTMGSARAGHGATLLDDGRVLITGGFSLFSVTDILGSLTSVLGTTEFFDPSNGRFTPGPGLIEPRALHTSSKLTDGRVLIAGGITLLPVVSVPTVSATAYAYDPGTGSFGLPSFFSGARFLHSAVGLSDGKVLLAGGLSLDLSTFLTSGEITDITIGTLTDCQLFSTGLFGLGTFTTVDGMQEGRAGATVAALPNGQALIAGGFSLTVNASTLTLDVAATETADRFSQGPNQIVPTGSMGTPRIFGIAANLPDGTVLVTGGGAGSEVYQR